MKQRFGHEADKDSPHQVHDYVIYMAHEETLMKRFSENRDFVINHVKEMLPDLDLKGQWSLDIMQNASDFYLIDMALANDSALQQYVPKGLLKEEMQDWLPVIPDKS